MMIACGCVCPTHKMMIGTDSMSMFSVELTLWWCYGSTVLKSTHASRDKERACHRPANGPGVLVCCRDGSTVLKERAYQPCEKSVHTSRVKRACMPALLKERACQPCREDFVRSDEQFPMRFPGKHFSSVWVLDLVTKVEKCFENTFGKVRPSRSDLTTLRLRATNIWERLFDVVFKWVIQATPLSRSFRPRVKARMKT